MTMSKVYQTAAGLGFRALVNLNTSDFFESEPSVSDGIVVRLSDGFNPVSLKGVKIPAGADATVRADAAARIF